MDKSDVVIIGGVACGCKAAATLSRRDGSLKITLFQKEKDLSYGTCGLPYFASGDIDNFRALTTTSWDEVRDANYFRKTKGFEAVTESEVIEIKRNAKTVMVRDLKSGREYEHGYDKLVIATGAGPRKLPLDIPRSSRIQPFTRPEHAINFRQMAQTGKIGSALIIGGGFIGCEVAEACAGLWGIETALVESEKHILPFVLDYEMALRAEKELRDNSVILKLGTRVTGIKLTDDDQVKVTLDDGEIPPVDYVFVCVGVRPNTELAVNAGLKIGETGGIWVNEFMQTSDPDIYAGGDVIESTHQITGKPIYMPMGSLANRHGRIIAEHIAAGQTSGFPGVLGAFLVKIFNLNIGAVGLNKTVAEAAGSDVLEVWGTFVDRPDYYPESKSISLKMIVDKKSGELLGLQGIGQGDIVRRVDVFSTFLRNKSNIYDLLNFEHGYAPPYSEALDPLHHLAAEAIAAGDGFIQVCPGDEYDGEDILVLDVRQPEEMEASPLKMKNNVHIPLNQLKENLDKLDKGKKIAIVCHRGPRSYQAARILKEAGFRDLSIIGGGVTLALKALA